MRPTRAEHAPIARRILANMTQMTRLKLSLLAAAALAAVAVVVLPRGEQALAFRLAADDPARLADLMLARSFSAEAASREIENALAGNDAELAESFIALADQRGIPVSEAARSRAAALRAADATFSARAKRFGTGFIAGEAYDVTGLAGAATGDLIGYGDVRDLARQGTRWVRGEAIDPVMLGLASVGLAATAATVASLGSAAPARTGVSVMKVATRTGRVSGRFVTALGRAVRAGRINRVADAAADVGRVQRTAGTRAALAGVGAADDLGDLAKVRRLADAKGPATLAILKTLGRGALVVGAGALWVATWVTAAAANLLLLVIAISSALAALLRVLWPRRRGPGRERWRKPQANRNSPSTDRQTPTLAENGVRG